MAHQAILIRETNTEEESEEKSVTNEIAKEFEGEPFLGPNSIVLTKSGGTFILTVERIYFSDSGPWGETSIQEPKVE